MAMHPDQAFINGTNCAWVKAHIFPFPFDLSQGFGGILVLLFSESHQKKIWIADAQVR